MRYKLSAQLAEEVASSSHTLGNNTLGRALWEARLGITVWLCGPPASATVCVSDLQIIMYFWSFTCDCILQTSFPKWSSDTVYRFKDFAWSDENIAWTLLPIQGLL